jgi:pilus assembly protein CpaB
LALVAAKLTHDVIAGKKTSTKETGGDFVQIVVARGDMAPGAVLTKENLTLAPMPGKTPPAHTYTSTEDLVNRVATQQLVQGQPINEKLLAPQGSGAGLQALVPAGMRAVTIEVNEFTGLAGMVNPNMNVDVVATFRDDATHDTVSRTVVQNLKILAVGPRMTPSAEEGQKEAYKSVTLLASPKDAERVELATYSGRPRLALRSGRDLVASATKGASLAEVVSGMTDGVASSQDWIKGLLTAAKKQPATRPVETISDMKNVKPAPIESDPFGDAPKTQQRTVKVIRNGVESSVIFEIPKPNRSKEVMTDTTPALESATK